MLKINNKMVMIAILVMIIVLQAGVVNVLARGFFSSFYLDNRARNVGDLVTIKITEQATALQRASTSMDKDSGASTGPGLGILDFIPLIRFDSQHESSSDGITIRDGQLEAKLTAEIVDITPVGNLVIRGEQKITINKEEQIIIITGTVRPSDVSRDNIVLSGNVANAEIEYKGEGAVGDPQSVGLLTRLFNWIF